MRIVKLFFAAIFFIIILDEMIRMQMLKYDKKDLIRLGLLMIMEMYLLEG